jgi:hypothetical protein
MSDSLEPFADSSYIKGSQTYAVGPVPLTQATSPHGVTAQSIMSSNLVVSIEQEIYGTGKPRRVITRGQIIRDRK